MFGLPGQTVEQALADIANAVALQPAHLSYYQLTLEPNTAFHRAPPTLPDDETTSLIQERAQAELARRGYRQYEVSAYARDGWRCRHNLNYWEFGDYLGIGAGAHGKLTDPAAGRIHRLWKLKQPRDYLASAGTPVGIGGDAPIPEVDLPLEFLMNACVWSRVCRPSYLLSVPVCRWPRWSRRWVGRGGVGCWKPIRSDCNRPNWDYGF